MKKSFFAVKIFAVIIIMCISSNAFASDNEGYINVPSASVRSGPSNNNKVTDTLVFNIKFEVLEQKKQWYKIKYGDSKVGWIGASQIRLIEKSNILVDFLNINDKFKKYFTDNLLFLDNQLKGYDISNLKLAVSYSQESNVARMGLIIPFDKDYYDEKKTKEISGSFIDFMVYNEYLWGLMKYKTYVAESVEKLSLEDYQTLMLFKVDLIIINEKGDSIILSGTQSGGYVEFNPYIDTEFIDYEPFRVFTPDTESIGDKSVFYLPPARASDGKLTSATLLYNFFDLGF